MRRISFESKVRNLNLTREKTEILQVNLGKLCNQSCLHCHVEAGPNRTENMNQRTIERLIFLLKNSTGIKTIDITGGAPELNPNFKKLVTMSKAMEMEVIDRSNLTILFEPGQKDLAFFLAENKVRIIASLPCYLEDNVNAQRGKNVFTKSINAIRLLNSIGYGSEDLVLDLVFNPLGPNLPPSQKKLEELFKVELGKNFGIKFNSLFTITNMPIKRFLDDLKRINKLEEYMELLINSFNPESVKGVMCRSLISVGYDGKIYDCDFNQMLEIPLKKNIWEISSLDEIQKESIIFGEHCFGCTAGEGSSCRGALV